MPFIFFVFAISASGSASSAQSSATLLEGQDLLKKDKLVLAPGTKGSVVIFLSARCPCSASHLDRIRNLKADFPDFQFAVVHTNADEPASEAREYFGKAKLPLPVLEDNDGALAKRFRASRTPHAFVISLAGDVLYRGGVTDSTDGRTAPHEPLREALNDVVAKREVRKKETRALGCAISRGKHVE